MSEEREDNTPPVSEWAEYLEPIINTLLPRVIEYHRIKAPEIKRRQYNSLFVVLVILVSSSVLAWHRIIDGSAIFTILLAVMWYIFGSDRSPNIIDMLQQTKK